MVSDIRTKKYGDSRKKHLPMKAQVSGDATRHGRELALAYANASRPEQERQHHPELATKAYGDTAEDAAGLHKDEVGQRDGSMF